MLATKLPVINPETTLIKWQYYLLIYIEQNQNRRTNLKDFLGKKALKIPTIKLIPIFELSFFPNRIFI